MAIEPEYIEITGALPGYPDVEISSFRGYKREYCITCHKGIEEISKSHPMEWGCAICHLGNPDSLDKDEAHLTLLYGAESMYGQRNPSNLRIVDFSCGQKFCHAGHADNRLNHIERVKKSIMSSQTGIISFIRYLFGKSMSVKSIYEYLDRDEDAITGFSDSKWRKSCARCHLWSEGKQEYGRYRAQGCAACHVLYDDDGLYKGKDPTIPKDIAGYPRKHKLTISIPSRQCNICHKNSSTSISGTTFEGIDIDYKSNPFIKDIHLLKGMECIDCHTVRDVMGDGRSYTKGIEQVEIKCRSCHGDYKNPIRSEEVEGADDSVIRLSNMSGKHSSKQGDVMLLTERWNKFSNVKIQKNKVVLFSKLSGKKHTVPQITGKRGAHSLSSHKRLECSVCHSLWVPQYYGSIDILDMGQGSKDWMSTDKQSANITGKWFRFFTYKRLFNPSLGINSYGKVSIFAPLYQLRFSAIDEKGHPLAAVDMDEKFVGYYDNFIFATTDGHSSALASVPVYPHSTRKRARLCEDCHINPKTLGFGEWKTIPEYSASGYNGARGFTKDEINSIVKVGLCITCHDRYTDYIYKNIEGSYIRAGEDKHKKIIRDFLK